MNRREQTRATVLNAVLDGSCTTKEAATILGLSDRSVLRLKRAYREQGPAALAHGNRGRRPAHALSEGVRTVVRQMAGDPTLAGYNHTHLAELLHEQGVLVGRRSVSRILSAAGIRSPQRRRPRRHRARRERSARAGLLIQVDGSKHDWLEGRGPRLTLQGGVDDATGTIVAAVFREEEDATGYQLVLRDSVRRYGLPCAWYSDQHGIFQRNDKEPWTLAEELAGRRRPTQLGRALETLGIRRVVARSPQAKGRVERCWRTLQDRLVKELRRAGASSLAEANAVLAAWIPVYNARFSVAPADPKSAYGALPRATDLDSVCSFHHLRTVANDNTIQLGGRVLQIPPGTHRRSYAGARVRVEQRLDSTVVVCHGDRVLARTTASALIPLGARRRHDARTQPQVPPPRHQRSANATDPAPTRRANPAKPPASHPWRRPWVETVTKSLAK